MQGGLAFTKIVAGGTHSCALTSDGAAYCWGLNSIGQLGDNSLTARSAPVAVAGSLKFTNLTAGAGHTCGLTSDGSAYCWGSNGLGQLGDGTTTNRPAPVAVTGGLHFQMITAGGYSVGQTCGVTLSGDAYCWGDNGFGQLGIGSGPSAPHPSPTLVAGGLKWTTLATGLGQHSCGVTTAGTTYCWGDNEYGSLGDGTTTRRDSPVQVIGGVAFAQLAAGGFIGHSCGLTSAGKAYCWGENEVGAIGDGTTIDRLSPAAVVGELTFTTLVAGYRHSCGRTTTGTVYCWGSGRAGQLGNNSLMSASSPARVVGQP